MARYPLILSSEHSRIPYWGEDYRLLGNGVDLAWLNSGRGGFFMDHVDMYRHQIGTIVANSAHVDYPYVRAEVDMWPIPEAAQFEKVLRARGELAISVGFRVMDRIRNEFPDEYGVYYHIAQWMPIECSVVGVPADPEAIIYHEPDSESTRPGRPGPSGGDSGGSRGPVPRNPRRQRRYARRARGGRGGRGTYHPTRATG